RADGTSGRVDVERSRRRERDEQRIDFRRDRRVGHDQRDERRDYGQRGSHGDAGGHDACDGDGSEGGGGDGDFGDAGVHERERRHRAAGLVLRALRRGDDQLAVGDGAPAGGGGGDRNEAGGDRAGPHGGDGISVPGGGVARHAAC